MGIDAYLIKDVWTLRRDPKIAGSLSKNKCLWYVYISLLLLYVYTRGISYYDGCFYTPKGWHSQGITISVLILPSIYTINTPIKTCYLWAKRLLFCYKTWEKLIKFVKYGHILA